MSAVVSRSRASASVARAVDGELELLPARDVGDDADPAVDGARRVARGLVDRADPARTDAAERDRLLALDALAREHALEVRAQALERGVADDVDDRPPASPPCGSPSQSV
jgi:hypothetical protein